MEAPKRRQDVPEEKSEELTIEEAARLLFVSRTHLNKLLDDGKLSGVRTTEDGQRRIPRTTVVAYREQMRAAQKEGLNRMVESTDRMGLYDAELEGLPERRRTPR
ncbi:excisionase family DNA-binding protein [Paraburkholderia sp. 32]|uniref:excisionase family DNA-binding protein n=1 Tax=Paraburkholderia sp. 32 TaxID=2991057 RepID=UPI003D2598DF